MNTLLDLAHKLNSVQVVEISVQEWLILLDHFVVVFKQEVAQLLSKGIETYVCVLHLLNVLFPAHVELAIVDQGVVYLSKQLVAPALIFITPRSMILLNAPWVTDLDKTLCPAIDAELKDLQDGEGVHVRQAIFVAFLVGARAIVTAAGHHVVALLDKFVPKFFSVLELQMRMVFKR